MLLWEGIFPLTAMRRFGEFYPSNGAITVVSGTYEQCGELMHILDLRDTTRDGDNASSRSQI